MSKSGCYEKPPKIYKSLKNSNMNTVKEIPYRPSLLLQILMVCNVYLSIAWNLVYGCYILLNVSSLYDLHGICVITAYLIGSLVEFYRLRMGYKGNLQARHGDLCTFLILSPFVQLPILVFLLLSAQQFVNLLMVITIMSLLVMALEFVCGIFILWPKSDKCVIVKK